MHRSLIEDSGQRLEIRGTTGSAFGCLLCLALGFAYYGASGAVKRYLAAHWASHVHLPTGLLLAVYWVGGIFVLGALLALTNRLRRPITITADDVRLSLGRYGLAATNGVNCLAGPWADSRGRRTRGSVLSLNINGKPVRIGARGHELPLSERDGPAATSVQIEIAPDDFDRLRGLLRNAATAGMGGGAGGGAAARGLAGPWVADVVPGTVADGRAGPPGPGLADALPPGAGLAGADPSVFATPVWPIALYEPPIRSILTPRLVRLGFITAVLLLVATVFGSVSAPVILQQPLFDTGVVLSLGLGFASCAAYMRLLARSRRNPMAPVWTLIPRAGVVTVRDYRGKVVAVDRPDWQPHHYIEFHRDGTDVFPAMTITIRPLKPMRITVTTPIGYQVRQSGSYVHPLCWPDSTTPINGHLLRVSDADWQILVEEIS